MCNILMYSGFKLRARLTCTSVRLMSIVLKPELHYGLRVRQNLACSLNSVKA